MTSATQLIVALAVTLGVAGCGQSQGSAASPELLRERALECLKRGIRYEYLPAVRSGAIEALAVHGGPDALPWIRNALADEVPAVRFAAAMALGDVRDSVSMPALRKLLAGGAPSDRIAAIYALHRMGDTSNSGELARYLLEYGDAATRGNAAMVLGRIGGEGAVRMLTQTLADSNPALRANVLEAMARLGSEYALAQLHENAYGGIGAEEVFAINTLASLRSPKYADVFRLRMESALHLESKLAAARGLALLGDASGYDIALQALSFRATKDIEKDTAENQTRRVHELAAVALGAIGDSRALPALERMMNAADDPRSQIVSAKAILDILGGRAARQRALSLAGDQPGGGR